MKLVIFYNLFIKYKIRYFIFYFKISNYFINEIKKLFFTTIDSSSSLSAGTFTLYVFAPVMNSDIVKPFFATIQDIQTARFNTVCTI